MRLLACTLAGCGLLAGALVYFRGESPTGSPSVASPDIAATASVGVEVPEPSSFSPVELQSEEGPTSESAKEFLARYPGGGEIVAHLEAQGVAVDSLPAVPELEEAWSGIVAGCLLDESQVQEYVDDLVGFREGWGSERVAEQLNLKLRGKDVDLDFLKRLSAPFEEDIRSLATEAARLRNSATTQALVEGDFLVSPYTLLPGEFEAKFKGPGRGSLFLTTSTMHRGWVAAVALDSDKYAYAEVPVVNGRLLRSSRRAVMQAAIDDY